MKQLILTLHVVSICPTSCIHCNYSADATHIFDDMLLYDLNTYVVDVSYSLITHATPTENSLFYFYATALQHQPDGAESSTREVQ